MKQCDPTYIIKAYTKSQNFVTMLNTDMARIVKHDIEKGCSRFSCDTLYTAQDVTKQIATILFHHPGLAQYRHKGTVYRGMFEKDIFDHIKEGSNIMINTFVSTSTTPEVAHSFSGYDPIEQKLDANTEEKVSIFCRYDIKSTDGTCRALNIRSMSERPDEDEILLLPYSLFRVKEKKIIELPNNQGKRIEYHFEEQDDAPNDSSATQRVNHEMTWY